jgi:hypothetical protein
VYEREIARDPKKCEPVALYYIFLLSSSSFSGRSIAKSIVIHSGHRKETPCRVLVKYVPREEAAGRTDIPGYSKTFRRVLG